MKNSLFYLLIPTLLILCFSCTDDSDSSKGNPIEFGFDSMLSNYSVMQGAVLSFTCKGVESMDVVELRINGEKQNSWTNPQGSIFKHEISLDLGVYSMEIMGYKKEQLISADGRNLIVNASISPKELSYEFRASHPHNPTNFTQGYEFYNGKLFESTGNPNNDGSTKIAEINHQSGASIREQGQANPIFGEGITILGSKIYQISWQNQKCFVYDLNTFSLDTTFIYHGEGWGLCNDDKNIIMSNGTHELVYRDPSSFKEIKRVSVHTDKGPVTNLNEIEFFNGRVYANIWTGEQRRQQDSRIDLSIIVEINPKNGTVTGLLNIRDLMNKSFKKGVPNGIAYRKSTNTFWVTGKYWNEAYEIQINAKNTAGKR